MDDDIDIEEHDVLENPLVQELFPDISIIKKEITQCFEDAYEPEQHSIQDDKTNINNSTTDYKSPQLQDQFFYNKIILGSKPNTPNSNPKTNKNIVKVPKLVIQDLKFYLERNKRFCKECSILFPRISSLHKHKKKIHKQVVSSKSIITIGKKPNVSTNAEWVPLRDRLLFEPDEATTSNKRRCAKKISDDLSDTENRGSSNIKCTPNNLISEKGNKNGMGISKMPHECDICGNVYANKGNLGRHYRKVHKTKFNYELCQAKLKAKNVSENENEVVSIFFTSNREKIENINNNQKFSKSDSLNTEVSARKSKKSNPLKCKKCNLNFPYKTSLEKHNKIIHEENEMEADDMDEGDPNEDTKKAVTDEDIYEENTTENTRNGEIHHSIVDYMNLTKNAHLKTSSKNKINKCSLCNGNFKSIDFLIKHCEEKHKIKVNYNENMGKDVKTKTNTSVRSRANKDNIKACFHCKKVFPDAQSLIEHVYEHLNPKKKDKELNKSVTCDNNEIEDSHVTDNHTDDNISDDDLNGSSYTGNSQEKTKDSDDLESVASSLNNVTIGPESKVDGINNRNHNNLIKSKGVNEVSDDESKHLNVTKISLKDKKVELTNNTMNNATNPKTRNELLVCPICSLYTCTVRSLNNHFDSKHCGYRPVEYTTEQFITQCKYCPSRCINYAAHNSHIYKYHSDLWYKKVMTDNIINVRYAMESVAFKCMKCDIHFLSADLAKDHKNHLELLINWKCHCQLIFKQPDADLHSKQHNISKYITIYELDEHESTPLLFKCTKCAIHFSERSYLEHYIKCGDEICTSATYCKVCDILIYQIEYPQHESIHQDKKSVTDFNIIESEIISNGNKLAIADSKKIEKRKGEPENEIYEGTPVKRANDCHNCLTYCSTCKCFLNLIFNSQVHLESRCGDIPKHICILCGLVFTQITMQTHRKYHKKNPNLCMQDYKFYDLQENLIRPPIPEYPRCKICDVHFTNRVASRTHLCGDVIYLMCKICGIKLSESAYKLHMFYHDYVLETTADGKTQHTVLDSFSPKKVTEVDRCIINNISCDSSIDPKVSEEYNINNSTKPHSNIMSEIPTVQNHMCDISNKEHESENNPKLSEDFNGDNRTEPKIITSEITTVQNDKCDIRNNDHESESDPKTSDDLKLDNRTEPKNTTSEISTIQNSENSGDIIKMLYCCKYCLKIFSTYDETVEHFQTHFIEPCVAQSTTKKNIKCSECLLNFDDTANQIHQSYHLNKSNFEVLYIDPMYFPSSNKIWVDHVFKTLDKDFVDKIIAESIYRTEHRIRLHILQKGPNMSLIIYKCYSCGNFIDAECIYKHAGCKDDKIRKFPCKKCGLPFISTQSLINHESIHLDQKYITLKSFNIVLFNKNEDGNYNKEILHKANYFTFYQCRKCNVVIEGPNKDHICENRALVKCTRCELLFFKTDIKDHSIKHKIIVNFASKNMKVILFGKKGTEQEDKGNALISSFQGIIYDYTLYQCKNCAICIKNKVYIRKHACFFDGNRLQCPKCKFYFSITSYNHHLKTHKIDPEFNKENVNIIQFDLSEDVNGDAMEVQTSDTDTDGSDSEEKQLVSCKKEPPLVNVTLYKCSKCSLNFLEKSSLMNHVDKECHIKHKTSKQSCTKCGLLFTAPQLFAHILNHHGDKTKMFKLIICRVTGTGKDVIYKCSKCKSHFMDETEAYRHFSSCNVGNEQKGETFECNKCNLLYDNISFLKTEEHVENCSGRFEILTIISDVTIKPSDNTNSTSTYNLSNKFRSSLNLSKYTNHLYKCKGKCKFHYITENSWRRHICVNNVSGPYADCDICGLRFTRLSLAKHKYIHHEQFKLKKEDLIISNIDP